MNRPEAGRDTEYAVAQLRSGALSAEGRYDLAAQIREGKEQDPVRGLIAAYLYDAQGDVESVFRTAYYLAIAGLPVPFDIALLGRMDVKRDTSGRLVAEIPSVQERAPRSPHEESRSWTFGPTTKAIAPIAGSFPWLRQGWPLLENEDSPMVLNGLAELKGDLLASPFTTLNSSAGKRLEAIIEAIIA
jgi:hypothetical protein